MVGPTIKEVKSEWFSTVAGTWRRVWGGRKHFSQTKISE